MTAIYLPTQMPLGFLAMLGTMSLIGMMINNSNVLLEEIDADKTAGLKLTTLSRAVTPY